jgi:hypothetical protein
MSEKTSLTGIISPVVTPFISDERLDEQIFRREVKYLLWLPGVSARLINKVNFFTLCP